ncbi:hypothetical protein MLGJGCBP_07458 [Rhodococcus sp. T7]|nr:hypothetical protein MLGJGCBP_07458 [Rhodococcus sp. T7]
MHPLVGECTIPVQARGLAVGWHEPVNLLAAFTVYKKCSGATVIP